MDNLLKEIEEKMNKSLTALEHELSGLRSGRASVNLLDPIQVEAYGSRMPLNQVASVSAPEARMLVVQVWDKSMVKAVEKAISDANLGLNPATDGQSIRLPIPTLNEERRNEMAKLAAKYGESSKVVIRNCRRDALEQIKKSEKDGKISEDDMHSLNEKIQKLTDKIVGLVDERVASKEKEIKTV